MTASERKPRGLYVVGLTGGIASGKTTAADHLRALGAHVVDADEISRALTADSRAPARYANLAGAALPALRERFGGRVFDASGALNRAALGALVFSDAGARADLEALLHPMVIGHTLGALSELAARRARAAVLSAPLLIEAGMRPLCDELWLMSVPLDEQQARVMLRDALDREQARARIDSQMPLAEKMRFADVIIDSSGPVEATRAALAAHWQQALRKAEDCAYD